MIIKRKKGLSVLKVLAFALVLAFAVCAFGCAADGNKTTDDNPFTYSVKDGVLTITGYIGKETAIIIPDNIKTEKDGTLAVSAIEDFSFYNEVTITSVEIPASVKRIGAYAFSGCKALTAVTMKDTDNVTAIGEGAFAHCSALTEITLPNTITSIEDMLFFDCTALKNVNIPASVLTVGRFAFYDCDAMTEITIPSGVTSIQEHAFDHCSSLTALTIPESVEELGEALVDYCDKLTSVYADGVAAEWFESREMTDLLK